MAHDEFWNLSPTTRSINSSKSNYLPDWDTYFRKLVNIEYQSYRLIWEYDAVHKEFYKCAKEHINNEEVRYRIYRDGLSLNEFAGGLESVIQPVYKAAKDCGGDRAGSVPRLYGGDLGRDQRHEGNRDQCFRGLQKSDFGRPQ